jgi:Holliday junction resolvase RusA-like endonuclease
VSGWAFTVHGTPGPQGSKKVVGKTKDGRAILGESSKKVLPWREAVKAAVPDGVPCLDGPLAVAMVFTLRRPSSAPKREIVPSKYPDLSKLIRSTEDAITDAGLWADDARVARYLEPAKVWPGYDREALASPGAVIAAVQIDHDCWKHELRARVVEALAHYWAEHPIALPL